MSNLTLEISKEFPSEKAVWVSNGSHTTCYLRFLIHFIFTQFLLAVLLDCTLRLKKRKPLLVKLEPRIFLANMIIQKFVSTD
uniref:Uncharacterized protein n=1 Tax=Glossina palpalis gambiensis TaxID=67801 RepID=A0A1B0BWC8_9MUSC